MCAFNDAIDFSKDMIELGVATLGRLVEIQFADLTTFLEQQSDAMHEVADVRDVAGLLALQREYRGAFWKQRGTALVATRDVLQDAAQSTAKSWTRWMSDGDSTATLSSATPVPKKIERSPPASERVPAARAAVALPEQSGKLPGKKRASRPKKRSGRNALDPTTPRQPSN